MGIALFGLLFHLIVTPSNERVTCKKQHVPSSAQIITSSLAIHKAVGSESVTSRFMAFLQPLSLIVPAAFFKKLSSRFLRIGTVPEHDKSRLLSAVSSFAQERNPLTFNCTQPSISTKWIHHVPLSAM